MPTMMAGQDQRRRSEPNQSGWESRELDHKLAETCRSHFLPRRHESPSENPRRALLTSHESPISENSCCSQLPFSPEKLPSVTLWPSFQSPPLSSPHNLHILGTKISRYSSSFRLAPRSQGVALRQSVLISTSFASSIPTLRFTHSSPSCPCSRL